MVVDVVSIRYGEGRDFENYETMIIGFFDNAEDRDKAIGQARKSFLTSRVFVNIESLPMNKYIRL